MSSYLRWADGVDPGLLYPWFREALEALLKLGPYHWVATDGWRSREDQRARWNHAKLHGGYALPPGKSPHNYGCAIHLAEVAGNGPCYDIRSTAWQWLRDALPPYHDHLYHGRTYWRWHHVEWKAWTDVAWNSLGARPEAPRAGH